MNILILGGAGFLGSNLARRCLADSRNKVTVVDINADRIAAVFVPVIRTPFLIAAGFYALVTFASCISANPVNWILAWLGLVSTHLVYGARFIQGLTASEMPSKAAAFDHASEGTRPAMFDSHEDKRQKP